MNRLAGFSEKARRGLAVLKGFIGAIKVSVGDLDFGLDINPEIGVADSGDLEVDLPNLLAAVAEAAEKRKYQGVAFYQVNSSSVSDCSFLNILYFEIYDFGSQGGNRYVNLSFDGKQRWKSQTLVIKTNWSRYCRADGYRNNVCGNT